MRFGKRRGKDAPEGEAAVEAPAAPQSVTDDWLANDHGAGEADHSTPPPDGHVAPALEPVVEPVAVEVEAVVEGEAVELPCEPPVVEQPAPAPAYEAPAPAPHAVEAIPAARLADGTPRHEPPISSGSGGGAWPEPAFDLAERPEILVGAAFGGGLLLALILRRLGH